MYLKPRSKVFRNRQKLEKLIKLAETGKYSGPKLAEIFNCNKKTIFKALDDNRMVLPNLGRFTKRIFCDKNFFDHLNKISAYWLGFIAADGCLIERDKGLTISLCLKGKGHLLKFKRAVKTNALVSFSPKTNSVRLSIYSKRIFNNLVKLGVHPKKSLTIKHVNVSEYLMPYFIRGVFDGDG